MARKYTKVLELMQAKGGRVEIADEDLTALLGRLMYRLASYMSSIRRRAKLEVKAVRDGRKVVAYELVAAVVDTDDAPVSNDTQSDASVPVVKAPKAKSKK